MVETYRSITVYRDSPVWDRHVRWFNVPLTELGALWVAGYTVTSPEGSPSEHDVERHAAEIRELHPGCVLIY